MVEGRGERDFPAARTLAWRDPGLFGRLMALLTEATIRSLTLQIDAGAEAVMLFDSWAGLLAPSQFRAHVLAPAARIVAALRRRHPDVPVIGFPRMAGLLLGEYAAATRVQGLGIDTAGDLEAAAALVPSEMALQGNLDPLALAVGGTAMAQETQAILEAMRGRPFVFNLGHGIVPATPPAHVAELVRLVQAA